jgi:uncharacterized iron-regulated protein
MIRPRAVAAVLLACLTGTSAHALRAQDPHAIAIQDGTDYRVYDRDGHASSLSSIMDAAASADVLLVGEEHDDFVGHRVELELLTRALDRYVPLDASPTRSVVLSLEMFEQDVQYVVDEYLQGLITEEHFVESARAWNDYSVYYRPLVEAAKARAVPVVAANAPRRYVNRVSNEGPESLWALSAQARSYLPPLPYPGPSAAYRAQFDSAMSEGMDSAQAHAHAVSDNAIYAQALWDASMGYAIAGALMQNTGALVIHVVGSFHVARGTGIPERIADYRPGTRVRSVVMSTTDDIDAWGDSEDRGLADFVILTRTMESPHRSGRR